MLFLENHLVAYTHSPIKSQIQTLLLIANISHSRNPCIIYLFNKHLLITYYMLQTLCTLEDNHLLNYRNDHYVPSPVLATGVLVTYK